MEMGKPGVGKRVIGTLGIWQLHELFLAVRRGEEKTSVTPTSIGP